MTSSDSTAREADKGFSTFARAYGVEGLPGPFKNLVIVTRMVRDRGIPATIRHTEVPLATRQRWLLRLLSPFDVRAFAWSSGPT
jgi:hypothetical protein